MRTFVLFGVSSASLLALAIAACGGDSGTTSEGSEDGGGTSTDANVTPSPTGDAAPPKPDGSTPATKFTIGGTVTGLKGTLVLENKAGDALTVNQDGTFTFATPDSTGSTYVVTVKTQPTSPKQTCTVTGGTGTVGSGNVTTVVVNCAADKLTVGGTVSGLSGSVVLQNNGGDDITVNANGSFAFPTAVASGSTYAVTVKTQPTSPKKQTCTISAGTDKGTVGNTNVTSVVLTCVTEKFKVGGTVTGLDGSVVLQNNAGNDLTLGADGAFAFTTAIDSGSNYAVTVKTQPQWQTCTVAKGSGTVAAVDVTTVDVTCTNTKTFGSDADTLANFEFEDDVTDSSGNACDLTEMNGPHTFDVGRFGKGIKYAVAKKQGLDWSAYAAMMTHPFTIEYVWKPSGVNTGYQRLFANNIASDIGWYTHGAAFESYPSPALGNTLTANNWHYIACASTSTTTMDVWLDGVKVGNTNMQFTAPPAQAIFMRDDGASELPDGVLDAIRVSKVSRSAAEIGATWLRVQ